MKDIKRSTGRRWKLVLAGLFPSKNEMNAKLVWLFLASLAASFILNEAYVAGPMLRLSKQMKQTSQSHEDDQRFKQRDWGADRDREHYLDEQDQSSNQGFSRRQQSSSFPANYPATRNNNHERDYPYAHVYEDDHNDERVWE